MHFLLSAPIPSHPQNHGNRARLYRMAQQLKARGHMVSFIYCGFDRIDAATEIAMRAFWDNLIILPPHIPPKKPGKAGYFMLDDWVHPDMDAAVTGFLKRWKIDGAIAHYVWASAWLDKLSRALPRYIDAHDVFGDRHKILAADGMAPSFFYTSIEEEGRGLDRAQKVFAIQDAERKILSERCNTRVITLGHNLDIQPQPDTAQQNAAGPLRVGYFASDNPINQHSLRQLIAAISARPAAQQHIQWLLMGQISQTAAAADFPGSKTSFVNTPADFYEAVDVVINPHIGGTGLKIKSIEALSFDKPLVGTTDAMAGLNVRHKAHRCTSIDGLIDEVLKLQHAGARQKLISAGRGLIRAYSANLEATYDKLFGRREQHAEDAEHDEAGL